MIPTFHPIKIDVWGDENSYFSIDDNEKQPVGPLSEKCVRFDSYVNVAETLHIDDFEPEEIDTYWLTKDDYGAIKAGARLTVNFKVRYGIIDDDVEFCSRGLETKEDIHKRRRNQREAVESVLNEQCLQRAEGSDLPELIALLYGVFSFPCHQDAHEKGVRDAMDVHEDYESCEFPQIPENDNVAENVIERLAVEEKITGLEAFSSIEEWLIERFEKGQRLEHICCARHHAMKSIDIE